MRNRFNFWRRAKKEDGNATVEFVFVVPVFLLLFVSIFELGLATVRLTVLEHALDETMRDIRLSTGDDIKHTAIRDRICEHARPLKNCNSSLQVEMVLIDRDTFKLPKVRATCINKGTNASPSNQLITNGAANDLMFIRVCYTIDPLFESFGLSAQLKKDSNGDMQLVASSIFAQEPS
ncbi:MAG: TadE/TadG family type IV pilus assembly protein [Pseudomonadota bacterium]